MTESPAQVELQNVRTHLTDAVDAPTPDLARQSAVWAMQAAAKAAKHAATSGRADDWFAADRAAVLAADAMQVARAKSEKAATA